LKVVKPPSPRHRINTWKGGVVMYPKINHEEVLRKLEPGDGILHMVLDTDTYNEVDDQFALVGRLTVE